jgi:hypothetical protein
MNTSGELGKSEAAERSHTPGVISHPTNVVEHHYLVAGRLARLANVLADAHVETNEWRDGKANEPIGADTGREIHRVARKFNEAA